MAELKLTKNELRSQQNKLNQLLKYLPTLQLKKALLQAVVNESKQEIVLLEDSFEEIHKQVEHFAALLSGRLPIDFFDFIRIKHIEKRYDNIAGVEVPFFEGVQFEEISYDLFDTPIWMEAAIESIRNMNKKRAEIIVAEEKKRALEKELREVSIRVNLFEKILIPRCETNIKKIKVFLGDQLLAAVSQAKVAKEKIEFRKAARLQQKEEMP